VSAHESVPASGRVKPRVSLLQTLRDRHSLQVLDNFETLLEPGQRERVSARWTDSCGIGSALASQFQIVTLSPLE